MPQTCSICLCDFEEAVNAGHSSGRAAAGRTAGRGRRAAAMPASQKHSSWQGRAQEHGGNQIRAGERGSHVFHGECITAWLQRSRHCPMRCPELAGGQTCAKRRDMSLHTSVERSHQKERDKQASALLCTVHCRSSRRGGRAALAALAAVPPRCSTRRAQLHNVSACTIALASKVIELLSVG